MTNVTGFLRDPNQAPTIAAHNAETVANLREGLIKAQKERIADLEAEVEALRAVAVAVERLEAHELGTFAEFGNIPNEDLSDEYMRSLLYAAYEAMRAARDAGYLPGTEGISK